MGYKSQSSFTNRTARFSLSAASAPAHALRAPLLISSPLFVCRSLISSWASDGVARAWSHAAHTPRHCVLPCMGPSRVVQLGDWLLHALREIVCCTTKWVHHPVLPFSLRLGGLGSYRCGWWAHVGIRFSSASASRSCAFPSHPVQRLVLMLVRFFLLCVLLSVFIIRWPLQRTAPCRGGDYRGRVSHLGAVCMVWSAPHSPSTLTGSLAQDHPKTHPTWATVAQARRDSRHELSTRSRPVLK